jgi:hypothetical protein
MYYNQILPDLCIKFTLWVDLVKALKAPRPDFYLRIEKLVQSQTEKESKENLSKSVIISIA